CPCHVGQKTLGFRRWSGADTDEIVPKSTRRRARLLQTETTRTITKMPVTLDPSAAALAKMMKEAGRPALDTLPPPEARVQSNANRAAVQPDPPAMQSVEDMRVPAPHGTIPLRVYKPLTLPKADVAPVLVYYHGGGWVIGDLDSHDVVCREIATRAGLVVIAVDYRLAPEHKFPAAVDDCIAATDWV